MIEISYLEQLPPELWRQIFAYFHSPKLDAEHSTEPLIFLQPFSTYDRLLQRSRVQLLQICKALYPIIAEIAYTELVFSSEVQLRQFKKMNQIYRSTIDDIRRPGEWTKRLLLSFYHATLDELSLTFPNVRYVQLDHNLHTNISTTSFGAHSIQTLVFYPQRYSFANARLLFELSQSHTSLSYLDLGFIGISENSSSGDSETVIFPALRKLAISCRAGGGRFFARVQMPCLRWLTIRFITLQSDWDNMRGVISNVGSRLEGLQLCYRPDGVAEDALVPLLSYWLFNSLPRLHTLCLFFNLSRRSGVQRDFSSIRSSSLRVLVYDPSYSSDNPVSQLKPIFTADRFPSLKRVRLVMDERTSGEGGRKLAYRDAEAAFPGAQVGIWVASWAS